jgi:DNA polymerase I-like protein with 3'-5' exonuclease and polymerase domains
MKAVGFGIIYGAGAQTIAQEIDIPDEDVVKRLAELQNREKFATAEDIKRGRTLSLRMEKAILRNPVLTLERAQLKVVRESIAQDKITAYFQTFPGVKQYMEDVPNDCRILKEQDFHGKPRYRPMDKAVPEDAKYDWDFGRWWGQPRELTRTGHAKPFGFVMTFLGRYRRLEDIDHKNYRFKSEANRQATNVTIQGSASDIIKGAMLRIERNRSLNMMSVEIVNQVHDELVCQCPKRYSEKAAPIIEECMIHPFGHGQEALCIPLPVDLKKVDRWSEAK